jgi:hypothetical protein
MHRKTWVFQPAIIIYCFFLLLSPSRAHAQYNLGDTLTPQNAAQITTFDTLDINSMVTYYFASRLRGDDLWRKALPDSSQWTERMKYSLNRHGQWQFLQVVNHGLKFYQHLAYVEVYMHIAVNGEEDDGVDEVEIDIENGHYIIIKVPI